MLVSAPSAMADSGIILSIVGFRNNPRAFFLKKIAD